MAAEMMNLKERYKYLRLMKERYQKANRRQKGELLDEMEQVTLLHRKHLIARMNGPGPYRSQRPRERSREYDDEVDQVIAIIAETLDWICAERIQPTLAETAQQLVKFNEIAVSDEVMEKLGRISISSVGRALARVRPQRKGVLPRARRGRSADNAAAALVPVSVIPWDEPEPGHFEVDLVQHGPPDGKVAYTIQCIDVLTGWSERFAMLGNSYPAMWQAFHTFNHHCPIPVREIHSDNGPEFINHALNGYFGRELADADQTRGRKGYKNDNRFVEQKNDTLVRAYVGHLHLHTRQHVRLLNALYSDMWLYYNFFQPVLRQIERTAALKPDGTCRITRKHDVAKTPLKRLLQATPPLGRALADRLTNQRDLTNPRALNRKIHQQLDLIYESAAPPDGKEEAYLGKITYWFK